jgi:diguanylate cyclase
MVRGWLHKAMRMRRSHPRPSRHRLGLRIFTVVFCISLVSGVIGLFEPIDWALRVASERMRFHAPSGQFVVVSLDQAHGDSEPGMWSRPKLGALIDRLNQAGVRHIALEADLSIAGKAEDDAALEHALAAAKGKVVLSAQFGSDRSGLRWMDTAPLPRFARFATVASNALEVPWNNVIQAAPYALPSRHDVVPGIASAMTGVSGESRENFPIDFAIDVHAVSVLNATDILAGRWDPRSVSGRSVVIGETAQGAAMLNVPVFTMLPKVMVQAEAAETLIAGKPLIVSWFFSWAPAVGTAAFFLFSRRRRTARATLAGTVLSLLVLPLPLETHHIYVSITPALFMLGVVAITHLWFKTLRKMRNRGMTNPVTGMPTLIAMREAEHDPNAAVVVAKICNFAEISTTLPPMYERELVEQIANRLSVGADGAPIYQADDGIFIWLGPADSEERIGEQLVALHALFRSPVVVATRLIDLNVTFGLDVDTRRPATQRVSSALVAADRAFAEGRRWMTYDPAELEDAEWKMSLLARLDQAVDLGEIWVAFQPKVDLASGRIVGAEALARWSHPEKGEIPPNHFIPAAEQSGRIEKLTQHVLEVAVQAAATIHRTRSSDFSIAVNISARLLDGPGLIAMVNAVLARHRLPPHLLILEVTETAAMSGQDEAFAALQTLSGMGVRLSIDDYGTGFSTLDYLKRIPADEIKIDRSFISMLEKSQSDRIMVHSTIQLAHSLGRKAIAEGVETAIVLNELRLMQCDMVQGYLTGRPMKFEALLAELPHPGAIVAA